MSDPVKLAEAASKALAAIAVSWPQYEATSESLTASTIPGSGDRTSGGDVSDPTSSIASSREAFWGNVTRLNRIFSEAREVLNDMNRVRKHHPETARQVDAAIKAARCDGSVDPLCVRNAVRAGKCWPCYRQHLDAGGFSLGGGAP